MNFSPGDRLKYNTVIIILDCWATKIHLNFQVAFFPAVLRGLLGYIWRQWKRGNTQMDKRVACKKQRAHASRFSRDYDLSGPHERLPYWRAEDGRPHFHLRVITICLHYAKLLCRFPHLYHLSTLDQRCLPTRAVCALWSVHVHSFKVNFKHMDVSEFIFYTARTTCWLCRLISETGSGLDHVMSGAFTMTCCWVKWGWTTVYCAAGETVPPLGYHCAAQKHTTSVCLRSANVNKNPEQIRHTVYWETRKIERPVICNEMQ